MFGKMSKILLFLSMTMAGVDFWDRKYFRQLEPRQSAILPQLYAPSGRRRDGQPDDVRWFKYYNVPYPTLMAGLTIAAYHFVNEAAENDKFVGPNVDPLADLYIFDIGGVILFSSDAVKDFFSSTLNLTAWPGQPAWNPRFNTIENQGQYYAIRYHLPFTERTSLFYHFGDNGMLGLSFKQDNEESFSVGGGFAARNSALWIRATVPNRIRYARMDCRGILGQVEFASRIVYGFRPRQRKRGAQCLSGFCFRIRI